MIDVPVPVPPAPRPVERRLPPAVAPHIPVAPVAPVAPVRAMAPRAAPVVPHVPRVSPPPRYAAPVAPEELAKAVTAVTAVTAVKPKKKKPKTSKTTEEERLSFARPVRTEGLATLTGEAWPPILPREEVEGHDVPIRGERRADNVEVSSDEETAPALTQANVARASTAAAVAAGVVEPPDVDPELRSISPISTPGVFPWQAEKKTSKKKRAESPQSTWLAI